MGIRMNDGTVLEDEAAKLLGYRTRMQHYVPMTAGDAADAAYPSGPHLAVESFITGWIQASKDANLSYSL